MILVLPRDEVRVLAKCIAISQTNAAHIGAGEAAVANRLLTLFQQKLCVVKDENGIQPNSEKSKAAS